MVCNRCIKVVKEELEKLNLEIKSITLGEVILKENEEDISMEQVKHALNLQGFELLENKKVQIIEKIKRTVIEHIHQDHKSHRGKLNFSAIISHELNLEYHYLSNLFSQTEGITIEHFLILQKVERAKELLKYGELSLSEIAYELEYSSVQHLSNQFKKITGLTATQFRNNTSLARKPLDSLNSN